MSRNLGSPLTSTGIVVDGVQADEPQGSVEGSMDGGVDRSSEETSNDRGAKGWQIVIVNEGHLWPGKQMTETKRKQNSNA